MIKSTIDPSWSLFIVCGNTMGEEHGNASDIIVKLSRYRVETHS